MGDNVIVWSNGQENEHFLRFNFPNNCWKETKLSGVNTGPIVQSKLLLASPSLQIYSMDADR